ncbi:MAG: hypothetical protein BWK76_02245 [Desulfobulbaceae bacterium A2]|nr:MAG: hypothetical protein BWK76_02245 [Desulfobulbaceae bacterium A2]
MEPILSKEEIADLLAAVKQGRVSTDFPAEEQQSPRAAGQPVGSTALNLCQLYLQAGKSEKRIPNFDLTLDIFTQNYAISLTNTMQRNFQVRRQAIDCRNFQDCLGEFNNQGAIGVLGLEPLKHGALLHFDSALAFALVEIMLGATAGAEATALDRPLTTIELNVLRGPMLGACLDLQRAFRSLVELSPNLIKVENNSRMVNIVEPDGEVLVSRFNVKVGGQKGDMRLVIPYVSLEPLREKFRRIANISSTANPWTAYLVKEVLEMPGEIRVRSGLLNMTIGEIQRMRTGDLIPLTYDPDHPLAILVGDKAKFTAIPGERNGKKAVHITGRLDRNQGEMHGPGRTA